MVKRVGYPEDSTQSAYSSQLIRIPLSAIIFYLSCFISREATTRQWWGGDRNQLLGGGGVWTQADTHLPATSQTWEWCCLHQIWWRVLYRQHSSLCWYKLPVLSLTLSFPSFVWADCASRLRRSDWERLLSGEAYKRKPPLDSLLARLTLLIAQIKEGEARDGVRPPGKKEVKVKFYEICLQSSAEGAKRIDWRLYLGYDQVFVVSCWAF